MKLIHKTERSEIWEVSEDYGKDYYVYGPYMSGDPKVCPSLKMAMAYAR